MSTTRELLVYGNDPLLLQTRRLLLQKAGFVVWTTTERADIPQICETRPIRLLMLCHSLLAEETEQAIRVLSSLRPDVEYLLLTANRFELHGNDKAEVLSIFQGPDALLSTVRRIMDTDEPPHQNLRSARSDES